MNLPQTANDIRKLIIKQLVTANSGHTAGPLGAADIFTALYFGAVLKFDAQRPDWDERDRVIVSAGHYSPLVYATLAKAGYFPEDELLTFRKLDSRLQGHVHNVTTPGVETSTGPLGQGISVALGMAHAAFMDHKSWQVYCFTSDGEHNEGQTWEAVMWAGNNQTYNLTVLLDNNNIQIDGPNDEIASIKPIKEKYEAFKWHVLEVDGHDIPAIIDALRKAKTNADKPTVIVCNTTPGKGVDFMENDYKWHGVPPKPEEGQKALHELGIMNNESRGMNHDS